MNVLGKIPEFLKYSTITLEQHQRGDLPGAPPPSEAKAKPAAPDKDANWKQELYELGRYLQGLPSTHDAEARLAALESDIAGRAVQFETDIKRAYEAATTPFLAAWDKSQVERRIAELNEGLEDLHRNTRVKLAQAKALVEQCKEWNPKRKRYEELKARQAAIDAAVGGKPVDKAFAAADTIRRPGRENLLTF